MRILPAVSFSLCIVLSACSSIPSEPLIPIRVKKTQDLHNWHLQGRMAIETATENGQVSFIWNQKNDHFTLHFYGPLGMNNTVLQGTPRAVELKMADGTIQTSQSAETLMQTHFRWSVPIDALKQWIRGLPADGSPYTSKKNAEGQYSEIKQMGWTIQYISYETYNKVVLPKKMRVLHNDLSLRLAITEWGGR